MTKENAHLYLPYMQALVGGKTVEFSPSCGAINDWRVQSVDFSASHECYRIKPEPAMIPLGSDDVPPGSVIRQSHYSTGVWHGVVFVTTDGITIGLEDELEFIKYKILFNLYQIKRPGEDWKPCHKESNA